MRWMQPAVVTADPAPPGGSAAQLDGGWYLDTVRFAQQTPWLHAPAALYTTYGIFALALLLLAAWWRARPKSDPVMAAALMAPVSMVLAYLVNDGIKLLVTEPRPCQTLHVVNTVLPCDGVTDWSFPSNHTAVVAAIAAGLFFADRTLAWIATVGAVPLALTRVYVGAHYPHDVLAGLAVGAAVAVLLGLVATRLLGPVVGGLRRGPLGPLLGAEPTTEPAPTAAASHDGEPEPDPAKPEPAQADPGTPETTETTETTESAETGSAADPAPTDDPTPPDDATPAAETEADPLHPAGHDQAAADSRPEEESASATSAEHTR